jgi:hypothetical protein
MEPYGGPVSPLFVRPRILKPSRSKLRTATDETQLCLAYARGVTAKGLYI